MKVKRVNLKSSHHKEKVIFPYVFDFVYIYLHEMIDVHSTYCGNQKIKWLINLKLKHYLRERVLHFREGNTCKSCREDIPVSFCAIFQASDEVSNRSVFSYHKVYIFFLFYCKIKCRSRKTTQKNSITLNYYKPNTVLTTTCVKI